MHRANHKSKIIAIIKTNNTNTHYTLFNTMMLRNLFAAAALCASSAEAFAFSRPSLAVRGSAALNLMTAAEIDSIIQEAEGCAEGECALDEVEALITNLQGQQSMLSKRIEEIDGLVKDLETTNGMDDRPVDEVRETVRAIFRVFALGVSRLHVVYALEYFD